MLRFESEVEDSGQQALRSVWRRHPRLPGRLRIRYRRQRSFAASEILISCKSGRDTGIGVNVFLSDSTRVFEETDGARGIRKREYLINTSTDRFNDI